MGKKKKGKTAAAAAASADEPVSSSSTAAVLARLPEVTLNESQHALHRELLRISLQNNPETFIRFMAKQDINQLRIVLNFRREDGVTWPMRICDKFLKDFNLRWLAVLTEMVKKYQANILLVDKDNHHALARILQAGNDMPKTKLAYKLNEIGEITDRLLGLGQYFIEVNFSLYSAGAEPRFTVTCEFKQAGQFYIQETLADGSMRIGKVLANAVEIDWHSEHTLSTISATERFDIPAATALSDYVVNFQGQNVSLQSLLVNYQPQIINATEMLIIMMELNALSKVTFDECFDRRDEKLKVNLSSEISKIEGDQYKIKLNWIKTEEFDLFFLRFLVDFALKDNELNTTDALSVEKVLIEMKGGMSFSA